MEIPKEWTFETNEVAKNFNAHVREQLPWYDLVTDAIVHIARHYIPNNGVVYDIGASTGNIGKALSEVLTARNASLIAVESSKEMVKHYSAPGTVINDDATNVTYVKHDVSIFYLVLMFIPVVERSKLLYTMYNQLNPGGAMIIVDKVVSPAGYAGTVVRRLPMLWKTKQGASAEDIVKKELSLAGSQRPVNEHSLLPAPFTKFFQMGEFCGWIVEKSE
jgi:tRNA (cmo5U34)-methyltransferase